MQDIREVSEIEFKEWLISQNEKPYRAKQIHEWLWKVGVSDFDSMTNLAISLRDKLKSNFVINKIVIDQEQRSSDGTVKFGFKLFDGHIVEGVLIPSDNRVTACISSQVGCSLTCKFCATGYMKMQRNLFHSEIYDQVQLIRDKTLEYYNQPLTNIVLMGMGEPLLNYKNVLAGIDIITSHLGLNMASRRITLSTAGIAKMIKKLGDDQIKFEFALSLHAANDIKRNEIMPINESNSLEALTEALQYFYEKTKTKVTFEYIIFEGFNDSIQDAKELYDFAKKVPSKINIIEYNPIKEANFINTSVDKTQKFKEFLVDKGVQVNIRRSRGKDVDAACGQLAIKKEV